MKVAIVVLALFGAALAAPQSGMTFRNLYKDPIIEIKQNGRIINGQEAEPHSIPYQVFLEVTQGFSGWYCGGSVISSTVILTAGHCGFEGEEALVIMGAHRPQSNEATQVRQTSTNIVVHERFDMDNILNDIALIILNQAVSFNANIQAVGLPANGNNNYLGAIGKVSGWGLTSGSGTTISEVLRWTQNPIISNQECNSVYGIVEDYQVCMSGDGGHSSCSGDSGGPLTVDGVQIGIVSYGARGCPSGYPSAFTRTGSFLDWIQSHS